MNTTNSPKTQKKRRSCYDRIRKQILNARRSRRADPAVSATLQLISIFAVIFGRVPVLASTSSHVPYSPPKPSQSFLENGELARQMCVPRRYLDIVMSQGQVPYTTLFDHIRQGGALRRDALIELRKRIPTASLDWFDHVQKWGCWPDLIRCYAPNGLEEDTNLELLKSTLRWFEQSERDNVELNGTTNGIR